MSQYLIAHIGHTGKSDEHVTWWEPNSCGYTVCIEKAGLYTKEEATRICRDGMCIAVIKPAAEVKARSTPYYRRQDGTLNKLYDGGPHHVVPNDAQVWKHLFAWRLDCGRHEKATPIGSKARAIYLDGIEGGAA